MNNAVNENYELIVYIPTFNRKEKLENCLSIISREIKGFENFVRVFVSNNGSTDGTTEFLDSYTAEWLYKRTLKENQGAFLNIISAFDLDIKAKFVWIIGDDDYLMPNSIKELVEQINLHPEVDFIFCNTTAFPNDESREIMSKYLKTKEIGVGSIKSNFFKNAEVVDFEKLIDPRIADTLLGELMVLCFRQEKFIFSKDYSIKIHDQLIYLTNKEDTNIILEGMIRQPHNLALMENVKSSTKSLYLPKPKTFNFWGSADWLGDYHFIFPIIMMYLLIAYRQKYIITEEKYFELLSYYFRLFEKSFKSQLSETSGSMKFSDKIKAEFFEILFEFYCARNLCK
jgi:glycosyltransferase involved in cell wall biosynthesis